MDGAYVGFSVTILSGTDVGDTRDVTAYAGGTRVATVDSAWSVALDETSVCGIIDPSAPPKVTPIYVGAHTTAVPLPLDGKGKRLVRGKPVVYLPYQVYHAMPFTPLSISLTP